MANKDKLIENAQKFLEKGQLPKAIGEYQKIVDAFPKDFRNRQKLAELLSREKRYEEAQPHYEVVAKNFTDTGFYLKAIAIYKQMQKLEPTRVDIYLRLADLNEKQGLIGNSLNEYRSLVALYEKNHKLDDALEIMRKILTIEPDNCGVRGKLVETLLAVDAHGEAFEQFCALDRILKDRGDMAGIARLHAKFAGLLSRAAESRAPSAMPVGAADATAAPAAAAPDAIAATIHRAAPVKPAELPELAFDLDASPAPAALPQETAVLSPPPPAPSPSPLLASTPSLPLELDLELDLELELDSPSAAGMDAGPAGTAADAPVEEPTGATLPGASLILPEFIDFGLELAASVETAAGEIDAAPAAVDLPLPMDDAIVAGAGRADEPAGGQGLFDGLETLGEVEPAGESLPDDEDAGIEEFEELEELDDAEGAPPSTGFAALADGGHDAGVFLDEAAAAGFDEALVEGNREDEEDAQSHFDLGIAYKEMGLLNEAIAEFSKAAHQPSRRLDCLTLQGQCRHAMGEYKLAEAIFKEALGSRGLTDEVRVALRYELGLLYETAGLTLEALESFQFVADHDRFFRDVAAKLKSLRQALGLDDPSTDAKGTRPGRDRISYV